MHRAAKRKTLQTLAILSLSTLILSNAALAQSDTRTAVVATTGDASYLDPHKEINTTSVIIADHFFDALVERDPVTMATIPSLAESWNIVDPTTYVFHLRHGVRFHDGVELTASDVKYSFDRILDPDFSNRVRTYATSIESVSAIDDYTVEIKLKSAYAPILNRMASFYIVPQHYVESIGDEEFNRRPMGSGPYKFVEWVRDDHISMVANEDYWRGAPNIKSVIFRAIPDGSTRMAALLSGEAQLADTITADDVPAVERATCCYVGLSDSNTVYYLNINSSNPPFNDVRVRQALSLAIDWDDILGLFGGYASRVPFPSLPTDFGYAGIAEQLQDRAYNYDPNRARELLAEAGLADGFHVKLMAPAGRYPNGENVVQAIASQFEDIGLTADIEILEWGVFYGELYTAGLQRDLALNGTSNPLFDPDHWMATNFDPRRSAFYFHSDELTAMIDEGMLETDPAKRVDIYARAFGYLLDEAPYIWGYQVQRVYGLSNEIVWAPRVDGRIFMDEASWAK